MTSPAQRLLRPPSIALIVLGALLFVLSMLRILVPALTATDYPDPIGQVFGESMSLTVLLMTLASSVVCVVAGVELLRDRGLALAVTAAVLLLNPTSSYCLLLPAGLGIWLLVVLHKPEVRTLFSPAHAQPQHPPLPRPQ